MGYRDPLFAFRFRAELLSLRRRGAVGQDGQAGYTTIVAFVARDHRNLMRGHRGLLLAGAGAAVALAVLLFSRSDPTGARIPTW